MRILCRSIKWNFIKFIIDQNGRPVERFILLKVISHPHSFGASSDSEERERAMNGTPSSEISILLIFYYIAALIY